MLDSQNLLFESFPATPLGVSANRNDITNSGTMWSSNSSISSVDSEYLRSDIIGLLPDKECAPPSVKLSKKLKNEQPVIDPEARNSLEQEVDVYSRVLNYFSLNSWFPPQKTSLRLPNEPVSLAIPILRQNWLFSCMLCILFIWQLVTYHFSS